MRRTAQALRLMILNCSHLPPTLFLGVWGAGGHSASPPLPSPQEKAQSERQSSTFGFCLSHLLASRRQRSCAENLGSAGPEIVLSLTPLQHKLGSLPFLGVSVVGQSPTS